MKIKGLRWVIIGLIFLATVINYVDRSALGIMWGGIDKEGTIAHSLQLTKDDYALILKYPSKTLKCENNQIFEVVQKTV